jgi:cell division protease FtsH
MNFKTLGIWATIVVVLVMAYTVVSQGGKPGGNGEVSYSQLLKNIDSGEVKKADISGDVVKIEPKTGKPYNVNVPPNSDDLVKRLEARGSEIVYQKGATPSACWACCSRCCRSCC